jgi:hypothetical protein
MNRKTVWIPIAFGLQAILIGSAIDRAKLSINDTARLHMLHVLISFGLLLVTAIVLHLKRTLKNH